MTSGAIRSTLEMVEREIERSEAFLQARGSDPPGARAPIDRRRRDELVHDLLEDRRRRLEARLAAPVQVPDVEPEDDVRYASDEGSVSDEFSPVEELGYAARSQPEALKAAREARAPERPREEPEEKTPSRTRRPPPAESGTKRPAERRYVFNPRGRPGKTEKLTRADEWVLRYEMQKRAREKEKAEQERAALKACTFRPQINARSEAYAQRLRAPAQEPLVERLHHEADKRDRLRAKARDLLEEEKVAAQSFQPKIKAHPAIAHQLPIHERVGEIERRQRENLHLRRVEQELGNKDLTFAPKLAAKSERIVQRQRDRAVFADPSAPVLRPVEDRLLAKGKERAPPQPTGAADKQESAAVVEGFLRRQEEFKVARDSNRETYRAEADLPCTFHPQIAAQSEVLVESNHRLWGETQKDRVERLAVKDPQRRQVLREELGKLAYADCSFHPNKEAKEAEREPLVEDVHARLYAANTVASKHAEKEEEADEECTFAPKVERSDKYAHVKSHYQFQDPRLSKQIAEELAERSQKRALGARAKDERELKACTFQPTVSDRPAAVAQGPVVVRGLSRYLQLQEMAKKKREEAGAEKPSRIPAGHVTIPEPFHLSTATRRRRAKSEEPSFQPKTNESERRKQVLQLLEQRQIGFDLRSLRA